MKVIFLDIDGVLNHMGCKTLLRGMYFVEDSKIKLLKQIIDATGAKVVLSSTWRYGFFSDVMPSYFVFKKDYDALRDRLQEFGVEIFDCTPVTKSVYRGDEIKAWLESRDKDEIESFVIIDDDCDIKPYGRYFVQTSNSKGLRENHVKKAIKILNREVKNSD